MFIEALIRNGNYASVPSDKISILPTMCVNFGLRDPLHKFLPMSQIILKEGHLRYVQLSRVSIKTQENGKHETVINFPCAECFRFSLRRKTNTEGND